MTDPEYAKRFVALQAMSTFQQLDSSRRIQLLDGLALILDGDEAEEARHTAFLIQKSEEQQLKFRELLRS
jgi:hypothetical protein